MQRYDKDKIKQELSITQVLDLVAELGGEPLMRDDYFVSKTICHNVIGEGSYKLYYYDNTKLFKCYTDCGTSFDIFELVCKVKNNNDEKKQSYSNGELVERNWALYDAVEFVAYYFGYEGESYDTQIEEKLKDWKILEDYKRISDKEKNEKRVELKIYDSKILNNLLHVRLIPWEKEGISRDIYEDRGIVYSPKNHSIVIPHYDINNNLVGIRERTLVKEEEKRGKYRPAILNGIMYNHPLGYNLYNLNNSKKNIQTMEKAIVFEGEKSCLLYASYFGAENDISVACCGSSLINYQVGLLMSLGVKEIVIAFDKQFQESGDKEWKRWTKKLSEINNKYSPYVQISFMFDSKGDKLEYKDSPIDQGAQVFMDLFKNRVILRR